MPPMVMHDFKKIETSVLHVMLAAHSSYYGRELTVCEAIDCSITIKQLQDEIAARKNIPVLNPKDSSFL